MASIEREPRQGSVVAIVRGARRSAGVQALAGMTAGGFVDVTSSVIAAKKDAFEHLEELIAEFSSDAHGTNNANLDARPEVKHPYQDAVAPALALTRNLSRQSS
jgi:hypothetical protein